MINLIKSWAFTLFLCALACAFCESLVSSSRLKQALRVLMSFFVMLCVLSPFTGREAADTVITVSKPVYDIESEVTEAYMESVCKTFESYLRENFDENARVGKIYTLKDANGNIYITEVVVFSTIDSDTLKEIIRKEFGERAVLVRL